MYQNVSKCIKMYQNVSKCIKMYQNVSKCIKMYYEINVLWNQCIKITQNISKYFKISQILFWRFQNKDFRNKFLKLWPSCSFRPCLKMRASFFVQCCKYAAVILQTNALRFLFCMNHASNIGLTTSMVLLLLLKDSPYASSKLKIV
jgi:hypothetical protein